MKPKMVVELNSGGPLMTVIFVEQSCKHLVHVRYWNGTAFVNDTFNRECLTIIKDENGHYINTPTPRDQA